MENDTIFFAKVVKGVTLKYTYVDSTGKAVNAPETNENPHSVHYVENEENTVTFDKAKFEWKTGATVTTIKYARDGGSYASSTELGSDLELELAATDVGKAIIIYVVVTGGNE